MTQHAEEEQGEQSDMGAVQDPPDANRRMSEANQDSARVDNHLTSMHAFDLDKIYSRTAH